MKSPTRCNCLGMEEPFRDSVKSVLINTHLKDTLPDIDLPCQYNSAFDKHLPMSQNRNMGINTEVRALLNQPLKSRFEEFNNTVRESIYKSQQNEQLGLPRKPWAKPDSVTNFSRTFGDPSGSGPKVYEIILPPNVPKCVQDEWKTRDIAKRHVYSYNDKFNRNHTFGTYYHPSYQGHCTSRCLNWLHRPSDICVINKVQGEVRDQTWAPDGVVLEPLKNRSQFCVHHAYGLISKPSDDCVAATLRDCPPCKWKQMVIEGVKVLNAQRLALKTKPGISFPDIVAIFRSLNEDKSGTRSSKAAYLLLTKLRLNTNFKKLEPLLKFIRILDDNENVCYEGLIRIFNIKEPYPIFDKIQDIPLENRYYSTTYGDLLADHLKPFVRNEKWKPPMHDCDRNHIINPSACERNGLWHRDYLAGRSKNVIRDIFLTSGYDINDGDFEQFWSECSRIDGKRLGGGLVCVETFRDFVENQIQE